ncbi:MAG: Ig domain-containing protein [Ruminococcaceae bacterium]|nr:Ig domain-containing protein [Oscillospiraceae bacterium]
MKRLSAFLLSLVLMLAMMPFVSAEPAASNATPPAIPTTGDVWDGVTVTEPSKLVKKGNVYYYEISTCAELAFVAKNGEDWLGYNYALSNNLILNDSVIEYNNLGVLAVDAEGLHKWTPINNYTGTFDGNNYTISGIYVDQESDYSGLFGDFKGNLCNLSVVNSYVKGINNVGGIAGQFTQTSNRISNCKYNGAVVGVSNCGGIIGYAYTVDATKLENYGDVFAEGNMVGGLFGHFDHYSFTENYNYGTVSAKGNNVGGLAGYGGYNKTMSNCANYGCVSGNDNVGGIFGYTKELFTISQFCNLGSVTGNNKVGGLIGSGCGLREGYIVHINNCYNAGSVKGNAYVGGLLGEDGYTNLTLCSNYGAVIGTTFVGGCVGNSKHIWGTSVISNTYYLKDTGINDSIMGLGNYSDSDINDVSEAHTTIQMRERETFKGWDFTDVWRIEPTLNNGYPYLVWQGVPNIQITGLTLAKAALSLGLGDAEYLTVNPQPVTASLPTLTWKSNKTSVATVNDSGRVTAVGAGTAKITVSGGGFSATCTVTVSARVAEEYRIGEMTVRDANGTALTAIPRGSFLVTIPITKLTEGGNTTVMLASYTVSGQFKGLLYANIEDVPVGATVKITLPVDNSKGDIALLKAFTIASFSNPVPIGAAASFPAQ